VKPDLLLIDDTLFALLRRCTDLSTPTVPLHHMVFDTRSFDPLLQPFLQQAGGRATGLDAAGFLELFPATLVFGYRAFSPNVRVAPDVHATCREPRVCRHGESVWGSGASAGDRGTGSRLAEPRGLLFQSVTCTTATQTGMAQSSVQSHRKRHSAGGGNGRIETRDDPDPKQVQPESGRARMSLEAKRVCGDRALADRYGDGVLGGEHDRECAGFFRTRPGATMAGAGVAAMRMQGRCMKASSVAYRQ